MEWTAFVNPDGTIKNVRPGPQYRGGLTGERFTLEAPTFEKAMQAATQRAAERARPAPPPPVPYRHPAFVTGAARAKARPTCPCGATLGPREVNCAVCRREEELVALRRKSIDDLGHRTVQPNEAHLRILLEVREQWMKCPNLGAFSRWLNEQVEQLERTQTRAPLDLEPALV